MHKSEFEAFNKIWCAAWEQAGRNVTPNAIQLAFSALQRFEMAQIRKALMVHITDPKLGRNPPTVADIFRSLQPLDTAGWPGGDEAWGIAVRSFDEADTTELCDEIAEALDAARPIWKIKDEVGARIAFRDSYERSVARARAEGKSPRWWLSVGSDPTLREQRTRDAVERKRLPSDELLKLPAQMSLSEGVRALEHSPMSQSQKENALRMLEKVRGALKKSSESTDEAWAVIRSEIKSDCDRIDREVGCEHAA